MASKEDYLKFMSEVRKVSGVDMLTPDETGLVSIRIDDAYNVNFQFVEATGKALCFVEVATLPSDASVYRDLLVGGLFGKDTAGGYFAVEPESESVMYNYFFDLEEAAKDVEEFVHSLVGQTRYGNRDIFVGGAGQGGSGRSRRRQEWRRRGKTAATSLLRQSIRQPLWAGKISKNTLLTYVRDL